MKKLFALLMIFSLGVFTYGCGPKETPSADTPAVAPEDAPADTPADEPADPAPEEPATE